MDRHLKKLKNLRRGKKGSISKRIKQLENLMTEFSETKRIPLLVDSLQAVFRELQLVCEEIADLCDEEGMLNDTEDIRLQVEDCVTMVTDHLEARKEEPLTISSLKSSWVQKHSMKGQMESLEGGRRGIIGMSLVGNGNETITRVDVLGRVRESIAIEPTAKITNAPGMETLEDTKADVLFKPSGQDECMEEPESEKPDSLPESGRMKQEISGHDKQGNSVAIALSTITAGESQSHTKELPISGDLSVFDDDFLVVSNESQYQSPRMSYKYAANYTISGNNLRRKPLHVNAREESKTSDKSSRKSDSDTRLWETPHHTNCIFVLLCVTILSVFSVFLVIRGIVLTRKI